MLKNNKIALFFKPKPHFPIKENVALQKTSHKTFPQ